MSKKSSLPDDGRNTRPKLISKKTFLMIEDTWDETPHLINEINLINEPNNATM